MYLDGMGLNACCHDQRCPVILRRFAVYMVIDLMGRKLSAPDLALYRVLDEVLHYVWDPIGVSSAPQARDEYHAYLPQVFDLLRKGADESRISAYLTSVTTEQMGLSSRPDHDREVARVLLDWKECMRDQAV
jgi:hypothetical protein